MTSSDPSSRQPWQHKVLLGLVFWFSTADFLQSGVVAFNAAPIMGDIAVSPEEYSSIATFYAIFGILAIYKQRWLVERLGWRRFAQISMAIFIAGTLVCAGSHELNSFATGRMLMALGGATAFTMGRVIVSHLPTPPARFNGIKFFATGLATGSIGGPVLAGLAYGYGSWRWAFVALAGPALLIALLSSLALPSTVTERDLRSQSHPKALVSLMLGSFLLLHALQRSAFDWFSDAPLVIVSAIGAAGALMSFIFMEHGHARPPLRLPALMQRRYLFGLSAFTLTYVLLGANNYVLPVLIRQGMGLPLASQAGLLATGAAGSLGAWWLMVRLLKRISGPLPYYAAGFAVLAAAAGLLSHLSESANAWDSVAPALVLNGMFVMLVLATTAIQTFQKLQHDETVFSHANQLKNMLAQFGTATGVTIATLVMQWRSTDRYVQLVEAVNSGQGGTQDMIERLTNLVGATPTGQAQVMALLSQIVTTQATFSAVTDYFFGLSALAVALLTTLFVAGLVRSARDRGRPV